MKRKCLLVFVVVFCIFYQSAYAQYTLTAADVKMNGGTITDYLGSERDIIIPDNIGGVEVTSIGEAAFAENSLTSVTIPNSVTNIDAYAFVINSITSIVIPSAVTNIGAASFNRNAISEINGNPSKGIIYARNLDGSEDVSTIVSYGGVSNEIDFIPSSVSNIANEAFSESMLTSVTIPSSVTSIGNFAFTYNALKSVSIESNSWLTKIGIRAFDENASLAFITVPSSAYEGVIKWKSRNGSIYYAGETFTNFVEEYSLIPEEPPHTLTVDDVTMDGGKITRFIGINKNIIIPETIGGIEVTSIGDDAFRASLTSVSIPNTVTSIGDNAFRGGPSVGNALRNVTIPNSVVRIGEEAFAHNDLNSVTIPNSVTSLGEGVFNVNSITEVNGKPSKGIIYAHRADGSEDVTTIVSYGGASKEVDFIPSNVTSIGDGAFIGNVLTNVTIPSNITSIGSNAFSFNALKSVKIPSSVTSIGNDAFSFNSLTIVNIENNSKLVEFGAGAFVNNSFLDAAFPTSAYGNDVKWKDADGVIYTPGDFFSNFDSGYKLINGSGKIIQSIFFNSLELKNIGEENFYLSATSTSELPVSFSSSDETVATISDDKVTIVGVGTTIITATQEGNDEYAAAEPVMQTLVVNPITSVSEELVDQLSIYPNPVSDLLKIDLGDDGESASVQIINLLGQEIAHYNALSQKFSIDVSNLDEGLYIVYITIANAESIKKKIYVRQ